MLSGPHDGVLIARSVLRGVRVRPQEIAGHRIDGDDLLSHQRDDLRLAIHGDEQRRAMGIGEAVFGPHDLAIGLVERDERLARPADAHDQQVLVRQRMARVAEPHARGAKLFVEVVRPHRPARALFKRVEPASAADGHEAFAHDLRHCEGPVADVAAAGVGECGLVGVLPQRFAGRGVERGDDLAGRVAVHRVEPAALDGRRRMSLAQRARPYLRGPGGRPARKQARHWGQEIALGPTPHRPVRAWLDRGAGCARGDDAPITNRNETTWASRIEGRMMLP